MTGASSIKIIIIIIVIIIIKFGYQDQTCAIAYALLAPSHSAILVCCFLLLPHLYSGSCNVNVPVSNETLQHGDSCGTVYFSVLGFLYEILASKINSVRLCE